MKTFPRLNWKKPDDIYVDYLPLYIWRKDANVKIARAVGRND
jgi:hypothetical protein